MMLHLLALLPNFDFTYAYTLNFIYCCFGSLFWLPGVPIGSLFQKKLGPYWVPISKLGVPISFRDSATGHIITTFCAGAERQESRYSGGFHQMGDPVRGQQCQGCLQQLQMQASTGLDPTRIFVLTPNHVALVVLFSLPRRTICYRFVFQKSLRNVCR